MRIPTPLLRHASFAVMAAAIAAMTVAVALGWMSDAPAGLVHQITIPPLVLAVGALAHRAWRTPESRLGWSLLAAGLTSYTIASSVWNVWYDEMSPPPSPSIADGLWIAMYPLAAAGIVALVRSRLPRFSAAIVLDGLIAALGLAAIVGAIAGPAIARNAEGLEFAQAVVTFAYPVADLTLLAVVGFVFVVTRFQPGRTWTVLGAALVCVTVADIIWSNQVAGIVGGSPGIPNVLWCTAWLLVAAAALQPMRESDMRGRGRIAATLPVGVAAAAITLLLIDHFTRLATAALVLATIAACLALLRTLITVAEERAFAESRRQALTDELTGLPNRRAFLGRLAEAIETARDQDDQVALLMIDLDRFKDLNDTLGHAAGDDLLAALGPRLHDAVRRRGRLARLGGDEFGVVLPAVGLDEATRVAADLFAALERPFELRGLTVSVGASVGIAQYPLHAASGEELLQRADVAMYQAKHAGSGASIYLPERDRSSRDRLVLAADLRHAIHQDRLTVLFQPKAVMASGEVAAVEALVRWQHHSHGPIPPDQFVPLAEQTGLARPLTALVLEHSVRQIARWRRDGQNLRVAVNACAADLCDEAFPADVRRVLDRYAVPADRLQIEVTENTVLADPLRANLVLQRLVDLGVELSLDDFGTGHSSLTHLRRLPVREIKLDRSFVAAMTSSPQDAAIVRSTIELAGRLGLRVVAEGVEDEATWAMLRDLGCDEVQGYLLSPPIPPDELARWLAVRHDMNASLPAIQAALEEGR